MTGGGRKAHAVNKQFPSRVNWSQERQPGTSVGDARGESSSKMVISWAVGLGIFSSNAVSRVKVQPKVLAGKLSNP